MLSNESLEFHMIPSEPTEPGWEAFQRALPTFLKNPRPTKRELKIIHRLVTTGIELPDIPTEIEFCSAVDIVVDIADISASTIFGMLPSGISDQDPEIVEVISERTGIDLKVFLPRRGALRQYGKVDLDGNKKKVFAPHSKPIFDEESTYCFQGLSCELDNVYEELCDLYDQYLSEASTLSEQLRVISFFQFWGATALHPFWDANGRTFGAQTVIALNRIGFSVKSVPELGEIHPNLSKSVFGGIYADFLCYFLESRGLRLLTQDQVAQAKTYYPKWMKGYMQHMRDSLLQAARRGVSNSLYDDVFFLKSGERLLALWLSKEGFIDSDIWERESIIIKKAVEESDGGAVMVDPY